MARKVDYLQEEVRVLKEVLAAATGKNRIAFSAEQRRRLALKGTALTPEERKTCCQVVRPETILAWFRRLVAQKYDGSKARKGWSPAQKRTISACSSWTLRATTPAGATQRSGTRCGGLKIENGRTAVANILTEGGIEPAPERSRKRTWKQFLKSQWETLPFGRSAWSVNFGERHLRHLVEQFLEHYLGERYHQGIGGRLVAPAIVPSNDNGTRGCVGCRSRLGGLLNYYYRHAV